tara:strand:+ start:113 stop:382 length:270 start_codon:yes stop_codon:yes gene_type:complete
MKTTQAMLATALLLAAVNAQFVFNGKNSIDSWNTMSQEPEPNWKPKNAVGAVLGFTVFGIAYIYAVIMIFIDIDKRDKMYDDDIKADLD